MPASSSHPLWTADQCAHQRGIAIHEWNNAVYAGREPLPAVDEGGVRLWDSLVVRTWRHHGLLDEGEWYAQQCAHHHGIPRNMWLAAVREGRAPQPVRHVQNRPVWSADAAKLPLRPHAPRQRHPSAAPDELWYAKQCADHVGLTRDAFLLAVDSGLYPHPCKRNGTTAYWDAAAVRACHASRLLDRRAAQPTWTAEECARYHGVAVTLWRQAVKQGAAPKPFGKGPVWSAEQVRLHPTAQIHAWEEDQRSARARIIHASPYWTAQDCADYHGIPRSVWFVAVRDGHAPRALQRSNDEPVWSSQGVIALRVLR